MYPGYALSRKKLQEKWPIKFFSQSFLTVPFDVCRISRETQIVPEGHYDVGQGFMGRRDRKLPPPSKSLLVSVTR